jgi:hypothetical protein
MKIIKPAILFLLAYSATVAVSAQYAESWEVYLASYEKGPGSTLLNMKLKEIAPVKSKPFVLITGVKFKDCTKDGLPTSTAYTGLYAVSDSVKVIIENKTKAVMAGTFTYQCERLDYYYTDDTTGIRQQLAAMYYTRFKNYEPYIKITPDADWNAYLGFLYPNEETLEYMGNQKIITQLEKAGDKGTKPRLVDHWLYFNTLADANCFKEYALKNKFKTKPVERVKKTGYTYQLQISRTDKVELSHITTITLQLRKEAKKCNGDYDGWETVVVK